MDGSNGGAEAALKPLRGASGALAALRGGAPDGAGRSGALLEVADAVEASLRRLLRDDPHVPLELRLQALAPDELPAADLVSELRRRDRISIELAAAFHDLAARARRVREGAGAEEADAELALRVAERVEWEAAAPPPAPVPTPEEPPFVEDETLVHSVPPATRSRGRGALWGVLAVVLLVAVAAVALLRGRGDDGLQEGIAAFSGGRPAEAVERFRRYAEENPEDPRPRLYLARIHRRAGRPQESLAEIRRGLEAAPQDAGLHRELGFLLLDTGRPAEAVERFRSALRLDGESAEGWLGLVRALRATGNHAAAERVLAGAPPEVRALESGAQPPQPAVQ